MILGLTLFFVSAIFLINIAYYCNKCERVENGWFNLVFGILLLFLILTGFVKEWHGPTLSEYPTAALWWAAQSALFAFTYILIGIQRIKGFDGRVVGWWCLFVVINTILPAYQTFVSGDILLGLLWIYWAWLWLLFFISMGLQKGLESKVFDKVTLISMIIGAMISLWIPALMMLNGWW